MSYRKLDQKIPCIRKLSACLEIQKAYHYDQRCHPTSLSCIWFSKPTTSTQKPNTTIAMNQILPGAVNESDQFPSKPLIRGPLINIPSILTHCIGWKRGQFPSVALSYPLVAGKEAILHKFLPQPIILAQLVTAFSQLFLSQCEPIVVCLELHKASTSHSHWSSFLSHSSTLNSSCRSVFSTPLTALSTYPHPATLDICLSFGSYSLSTPNPLVHKDSH